MTLLGAWDFDLTIGGTKYGFILAEDEQGTRAWNDGLAPAIAPQVRDTAFGYDHTDPLIDTVMAFEQWDAGAGWEQAEHPHDDGPGFIGTPGVESHRYHYTQHVDLSYGWGVKSPAVQTGATTVSAATKFLRSQQLGHFAAAGQYIRYWNGSAWAESDDAGSGLAYSDLEEYVTSSGHFLLGALGNGTSKERYKYAGPTAAFRSVATTAEAAATSDVIGAPAGIQDDDILVAVLRFEADPGTITPASGFSLILSTDFDSGKSVVTYWKRASSESGSYTFSWVNSVTESAKMLAYSGCVTSGSPINDSAETENIASETTPESPALSSISSANTLLLAIVAGDGSINSTEPTGYTERSDFNSPGGGGIAIADKQHGTGPREPAAWTLSSADATGTQHIALTPSTTLTWTQSTLEDASVVIKYWTVRGVSSGEPVLYGITEQGALYSSTDPTNSGALTGPDRIGSTAEIVNGMTTLDDTVYVFKAEGIYSFDGTNGNFLWPAKELRTANSGKHHVRWRNKKIYVNYGNQLIEITPDNSAGDRLRSVFPSQGQFASPELNGEITAIAATLEAVWFNVENADGNNYLWKGNPDTGEWNTVAYFGSTNCTALLQTEAGTTDDGNQFHANNPVMLAAQGTNGHYLILPRPGYTPWDDSNYRFETTQGVVFGPFVDFGTRAYPAFLSRGEIVADAVDSNDTVTLQYQLPGGTATTIVVADDTTITGYDTAAADEADSVQFSTIRYKLLVANGAATTTPILKGVALHASPVIPRKRVWSPQVRIAEDLPLAGGGRSGPGVSVQAYLTALTNSVGSRMTLTDIWGTTHTVRLLDFQSDGARRVGFGDEERWEATYRLQLVGLDTL